MSEPCSSAIRTACAAGTLDAITTSACPAGSTARILTTSPTNPNKLASRASPAPNEEPVAGVPDVGIVTNPEAEPGHATPAALPATAISLARSICIPLCLVPIRSFLVPSRISVLATPGGVVGQTRPEVVLVNQRFQPRIVDTVSQETGHPVGVAQKPVPF